MSATDRTYPATGAGAPTPSAEAPAGASARHALATFGYRYGLVFLWLALLLVFSLAKPDTFATVENFRFVATSQVVVLAAALALLVPLVGGEYDLSVGSVITLSGVTCAAAMSKLGLDLLPAIALALAMGAAVGLINGFLVAYLEVNSLIATLGVSICVDAFVTLYTKSLPITIGLSDRLTSLIAERVAGIPVLVLIVAGLAAIVWYGLEHTPVGRGLAAVGGSRSAALLLGLRTRRYVLGSFIVAGTLAAIGGVLQVAVEGTGNPTSGGLKVLLPALAAVFLGATAFRPGKFNVPGTVIGVLFVATGVSGLTLGNADDWVQKAFTGGSLILAVALSAAVRRRRGE